MKQLLIITALILCVGGCNRAQHDQKPENPIKEMQTPDWANEVYAILEKGITKLDSLTAGKPEATPGLKDSVKTLKNAIVQEMLLYGNEREKMSENDQKICSDQLSVRLAEISKNPAWSRTWSDARIYYARIDPELATLIAGFGNLTIYSQFEVLINQEPVEAERLGIK